MKRRVEGMKAERRNWEKTWRDIEDYIVPGITDFPEDYPHRGDRKDALIVNSEPHLAHRVLASGMQSGLTSPSRPWFRLDVPLAELAENQGVKEWLKRVQDLMYLVFTKSNFYDASHSLYEQLGGPGIGAMYVEEDFDTVIRCLEFSAGSYWIAADRFGRVNTFARTWKMTAAQMAEAFGIDNVTQAVKDACRSGGTESAFDVWQLIEPNDERVKGHPGWRGMPFRSLWWESAQQGDEFLRVSGYHEFPVMTPRWNARNGWLYGNSPSWISLPDAKMLQTLEDSSLLGIERLNDPPIVAPTKMKGVLDLLPGGISYFDEQAGFQGIQNAYANMPPQVQYVEGKIASVVQRIKAAFFADLFLAITQMQQSGTTAREIEERHSEKLVMLGPVIENMTSEFLNLLIDRTFGIMMRKGLIPEPPEELQGVPLQVDYISTLAQAQKMVGLAGINDLLGYVAGVAKLKPESVDKLDGDQLIDEVARMLGTPPSVVLSDEAVAEKRAAQAQALEQQQALEQGQAMVQGAQSLSNTPLGTGSALDAMMDMAGGASAGDLL